jgi:hemin uptake protein HemP
MSQTEVQLIKDGVIVNADLHSSANISASKFARPIDLLDSEKIRFGTGNDLEIFHDGSDSFVKDAGTGRLMLLSNTFQVNSADNSEIQISAVENGAVGLYHNGSKKFETSSTGVTITGTINFGSGMGSGLNSNGFNINFADSDGSQDMAKFGASGDLQIYHDGSNSYIKEAGTGSLLIDSDSGVVFRTDSFTLNNAANSENMLVAAADGSVSLYNDNALRLQTTAGGAKVLKSDASVLLTLESTSNDSTHDSIFRMKVANASADCHIQFADPDDDDVGQIMYDHSLNALKFILNTSEEFRMEADGDFHADGDVIAASTTISSDLKLKENIEVVSNPIEKVEALRGVTFDWKRDGKKSAGVIAQDVEKVLPQAVKETRGLHDAEPYKTVNYHALTSIFIEAIKELSARVKELEAK